MCNTLKQVDKLYHHCSIQSLAVLKSSEEAIIPCQLLFPPVLNNTVLLHTTLPYYKLVLSFNNSVSFSHSSNEIQLQLS